MRTIQRHRPKVRSGEARLVALIVELAMQLGRYGDRRITALLRREGCGMSISASETIIGAIRSRFFIS